MNITHANLLNFNKVTPVGKVKDITFGDIEWPFSYILAANLMLLVMNELVV